MNLTWKNIVVAIVLLIYIYILAASLNSWGMVKEDFFLSNFDRAKTEVLFKFSSLVFMVFFIDFRNKKT